VEEIQDAYIGATLFESFPGGFCGSIRDHHYGLIGSSDRVRFGLCRLAPVQRVEIHRCFDGSRRNRADQPIVHRSCRSFGYRLRVVFVSLRPKRRDLVGMSVVLVLGVLAQVLIGAVVVLTGLNPYSNIAHFLVSIFLMSVAYMLVQHAKIFKTSDEPVSRGEQLLASSKIAQAVKVLLALTGLVVVGTLITGSGPHAGDEKAVRLGFAMTDIG